MRREVRIESCFEAWPRRQWGDPRAPQDVAVGAVSREPVGTGGAGVEAPRTCPVSQRSCPGLRAAAGVRSPCHVAAHGSGTLGRARRPPEGRGEAAVTASGRGRRAARSAAAVSARGRRAKRGQCAARSLSVKAPEAPIRSRLREPVSVLRHASQAHTRETVAGANGCDKKLRKRERNQGAKGGGLSGPGPPPAPAPPPRLGSSGVRVSRGPRALVPGSLGTAAGVTVLCRGAGRPCSVRDSAWSAARHSQGRAGQEAGLSASCPSRDLVATLTP